MNIKTLRSNDKTYCCKDCCLEEICESALYKAVKDKITLPDCNNGELYFQSQAISKEEWSQKVKAQMLTLLKCI